MTNWLEDKMKERKKPNLAYIGTGNISKFHIPALRRSGFNISSISSRSNSKNITNFAREFDIKNIIPDWKNLLDNIEKFDAVMIAVNIKSTAKILEGLMKTKKPILVEKPVSLDSKIIDQLLTKNHKNIFVAYNRRHYSSTQFAKKFIDSKPNICANFFIPDRNKISFYQNGCHVIDLMNYFFEKKELEYHTPIFFRRKMTGFTSVFRTKRGDIINLMSNWGAPSNFKIELIYKDEKIEMSPIERAYFYKGLEIIEPNKNNIVRKYIPKLVNESDKKELDEVIKPGFYKQASLFYNFVKHGKCDKRLCTLHQAKKTIQIIEQLVTK